MTLARLYAITLALTMIVGRWDPTRLTGGETGMLGEPRLWLAIALLVLAMLALADPRRTTPATDRPNLGQLFATLGFLGVAGLSSLWAPDAELAGMKLAELGLLVVYVLTTFVFMVRDGRAAIARDFVGAMAAFALLLGIAAIPSFFGQSGRIAALGGGPNAFGRNAALLLLVAVSSQLRQPRVDARLATALFAVSLVVLSGSRGAMVSLGVASLALLWVARVQVSRIAWILSGGGTALAVFLATTSLGAKITLMFQERFVRLVLQERYTAGRDLLYLDALDLGARYPGLGAGLAAFPALGYGVYPHNIALEAFAEVGLVGVALLLLVLRRPLLALVTRDARLEPSTTAVFVLLLCAAQFSGDFYDSRGVFLLALLATPAGPAARPRARPARAAY